MADRPTPHSDANGQEADRIGAVSVVIPHYGDPSPTSTLITQLREQVGAPSLQIIVADDCSPRPFPPHEGATVVRRDVNGGFGAAVNTGAALAQHPLLLVLNSDLDVAPDFVASLVRAAEPRQPAVCAPMLVGFDGATQWAGRRFPRNGHYIVEWLTPLARWRFRLHEAVGHDTRCVAGATVAVDWLVGAALLIPTTVFREVGGFDEDYFMNVEEVDLQRRLRERGIPSVFLGDVQVRHEGGGSSDSDVRLRWLVQSRLHYARKWGEHPGMLRAGLRGASGINFVFNVVRRLLGHDVQPILAFRRELAAIGPEEPAR